MPMYDGPVKLSFALMRMQAAQLFETDVPERMAMASLRTIELEGIIGAGPGPVGSSSVSIWSSPGGVCACAALVVITCQGM